MKRIPKIKAELKLVPEIKAEWLRRLRSGEYPQTRRGVLRAGGGYCCLGVLCDIAVCQGIARWDGFSCRAGGAYTMVLPAPLCSWAAGKKEEILEPYTVDSREAAGLFPRGSPQHTFLTQRVVGVPDEVMLSVLNDSGLFDFEDIARVIEALL